MIICLEPGGDRREAERLADRLKAVFCETGVSPHETADSRRKNTEKDHPHDPSGLTLRFHSGGSSLLGEGMEMQGDLTYLIPRVKKANLDREYLVRAARLKNLPDHPLAVDATAGMGEDSLLLAAAEYRVILYECNPVIAALLRDSLRRAETVPELREIVRRMELKEGDSIEAMGKADISPDFILLDPMFPERKKSALIKKKFQLLHRLESPCRDEDELLDAAIRANPRRLVIKRPLKGPFLAGKKPDFSLRGKAIRYDCFTIRKG